MSGSLNDPKTCPCKVCKENRSNAEAHLATLLRNQGLRDNGFRVELPEGAHAVLRDPRAITEGQRIQVKETIASAQVWADRIDKAIAAQNLAVVDTLVERNSKVMASADRLVVALFVESWSYETIPPPQPHDADPLRLLSGKAFDRLLKPAKDLWQEAWVDDEPTSMDVDSPFADSNSSAPTS